MHIDRVKGSFRNLKTEDVRTVADEGDGWIPSRKKNVTAEGAQDRVYLVVLVGTGAHLGQTRVELYAELQDGTETHAVPVDALNELNLFYGVGEIRTRQESGPPAPRPQQHQQNQQHQQHQQPRQPKQRNREERPHQQQGQGRRARIDIPAVVSPPRKAAPVERVRSTANPAEQHILVALETAGLNLPPKHVSEMVAEEFFSHLSREVGGPIVYKGRELNHEEVAKLDPEDLFDALVESKGSARS